LIREFSFPSLCAAHASLDGYISNWFGLDQSKYQWALNDYYETTGKVLAVSFYSKIYVSLVLLRSIGCLILIRGFD
jgi:hypothetical protein